MGKSRRDGQKLIKNNQGQNGAKKPPRFYKCHRDIADKASHHFKKVSIPLKMYFKCLAILQKTSISLKKSSKIIEIFIKAPYF
jgi:hypothetical protein